jgi:cellulose synthase/poly-beta-1,6-N-acetylglucosamine synthase-like glycosyltransferase
MAVLVWALGLVPAAVAAGYYAALTLVGRWGAQAHRLQPVGVAKLTVLIPAHDEHSTLPQTLVSLADCGFPIRRVLVVADNCTDDTAGVARRSGADCVERNDLARRGKGHAVAFGLAHALADRPDAVLILDADCTVDAGLLERLAGQLAAGADAVQAAVASRAVDSPGGYVAAVGTAIDNAIAAGADRLGLRVPLRGTGMLFRRELLERLPWEACGPTEDAEYEAVLRQAGVQVRFVADRCVRCHPPTKLDSLLVQRRRWREALRSPGRLFASKPLVLAHLLSTAAAVAAFAPHLWPWLLVPVCLTAGLYLPAMGRVGWPSASTLLGSFGVVAQLAAVAVGGFGRRGGVWQRTPRD